MDLISACGNGCPGLSHYPQEMLRLFEAWVSKELAIVERKVDVRTLEREQALLGLQLAELDDDLSSLGSQARLLQLIPTWLLKDLDIHILLDETQSLLSLLLGELYPLVDLRYPEALQTIDPVLLASLLGSSAAGGLSVDWAGNLVDWTTAVTNVADNVSKRVRDRLAISPPIRDGIVAIGIPNPNADPTLLSGNWQRVSPERAALVWKAIGDMRAPPPDTSPAQFISIAVSPSDLYSMTPGSTNTLSCNDAVPVVTAMAIYLVRPFHLEDFGDVEPNVSVGPDFLFPAVGTLKNYRLEDRAWTQFPVRLLTGEGLVSGGPGFESQMSALMANSAATLYRNGYGISPFGQFDIDLAGLTTPVNGVVPVDDAAELILGFRVTMRNVGDIGLRPMCNE